MSSSEFAAPAEQVSAATIDKIDAAECGLFDHLKPRRSGRTWHMTCPACGVADKAYYYPRGRIVFCNSGKCSGLSVWDVAEEKAGSRAAAYALLCAAAGVPVETRRTNLTPAEKLSAVAKSVLMEALRANGPAGAYLEQVRKFPRDIWARLNLGYYPSGRWLEVALTNKEVDLRLAAEWGLIPKRGSSTRTSERDPMANRIVGFWPQPDGSFRLWGRAMDDRVPKYLYTSGSSRAVPYNFRFVGDGPLIAVEGAFDVCALEAIGVPAIGLGGNCVTIEQAKFLSARGTSSLIHILDNDAAPENGGLSASEKGVLTTIRNCESLGIVTLFASIDGPKDVDELRRIGRGDDIHAAITGAVSGGAWLARKVLALSKEGTRQELTDIAPFLVMRRYLTAFSTLALERVLQSAGIRSRNLHAEAFTSLGVLMNEGVVLNDALEAVRRRYGLVITAAGENGR